MRGDRWGRKAREEAIKGAAASAAACRLCMCAAGLQSQLWFNGPSKTAAVLTGAGTVFIRRPGEQRWNLDRPGAVSAFV